MDWASFYERGWANSSTTGTRLPLETKAHIEFAVLTTPLADHLGGLPPPLVGEGWGAVLKLTQVVAIYFTPFCGATPRDAHVSRTAEIAPACLSPG
jgi:hypothetical protein